MAKFNEKLGELAKRLRKMGIRVKYDNADNKRPGFKFADYELKGVPVRLVMGGRDLENGTIEVMRRDTLEKETRSFDGIEDYVKQLLEDIQQNIFDKAKKRLEENTFECNNYDEFKQRIKMEVSSSVLGTARPKPKPRSKLIPKQQYVAYLSASTKATLAPTW